MRIAAALRTGAATAVALTALSGLSALSTVAAGPAAGAAALPTCPISALKKAPGPVDITFWNSMVRANGTTLQIWPCNGTPAQHFPLM